MNSIYYHLIVEEFDKINDKHIRDIDIQYLCESMPNIKYWSYILHDKDLDKHKHYHINLVFGNNGYEFKTILNQVARVLSCNLNIIQVGTCNSVGMYRYWRYLIHADDEEKYQYSYKAINTNSEKILTDCLSGVNPFDLGIELLIMHVKQCNTKAELFQKLGLKFSNQYFKIINDLRNMKNVL